LQSDIKNLNNKRIYYLEYIINLATKVFLFGKDSNSFEANNHNKKEKANFEAIRKL